MSPTSSTAKRCASSTSRWRSSRRRRLVDGPRGDLPPSATTRRARARAARRSFRRHRSGRRVSRSQYDAGRSHLDERETGELSPDHHRRPAGNTNPRRANDGRRSGTPRAIGTFGDFRPNVRRDGLEIVFDSNRSDTLGGQDLYSATRESIDDPWSTPVNLGDVVNTANNETRGSFSRDAETLYFGRAPGPEGSTDIYVSTRQRHGGQ